jgi:hypothetical protein
MDDDTAGRSITFVPRPRPSDEEATAILARAKTPSTRYRSFNGRSGSDDTDDFDDLETDGHRGPRSERTRWALIIGAVAAVVVVGLAIGYAVLRVGDKPNAGPVPGQSTGIGSGGASSGGGSSSGGGGALLSDASMLSAEQADQLDSKRTWKVELTQRGASEESPAPACFGTDPDSGQPVSQQKILRVLSSSGKSSPSALHEATAYATPEEAVQAFTAASRTLGTCSTAGTWLVSGKVVRGIGDQAAGAVAAVVSGGKAATLHSVIVSRTGRVLNVLDASGPGEGVAVPKAAAALAQVTKVQCGAAGGNCAAEAEVKAGPPPLGGDEPGYLAPGDLPPVAGSLTPWNAAPIELPKDDFPGASCETVNWATVPAENRSTRVYLQPDSGKNYFGVNEILIRTKDAKAATALVDKIKKDLQTCKERRLTATVEKPKKISSIGARSSEINGYTAVVHQKTSQGTDKFLVGIVAVGNKFAYTFANPKGDFDFTGAQWNTIAVRAGERVTQVT